MDKISIKPEREYLREIVSKIQSNIYAIPAFQRDFVWKRNQIIDLFDSISKGYPIGSIILWKPKGEDVPPIKKITTEEIVELSNVEFFILDGRQRCTAFLGCVTDWENKPDVFNLYYDVDNRTYVYPKKKSKYQNLFPLCDLFDTFKMLGVLQQIMMNGNLTDAQKLYQVNSIKEVNAILQTYEIGEMILENCTLEESSIAFSRINSKGTDISKVAMLQALTYKKKNGLLLADEISKIISSLSVYGFSEIKPDDILNCCYRYINKNHYDNNLLEAMARADVSTILPQLRRDVTLAVKFLNEHCGVISYKLLPYNRQLIAIAAFYKEHKNPTANQLKELKKWFFYTTYQQSFMNGSLSNIRTIFNRFEDFVRDRKDTAIDYEPIEIDYLLDFKFAPTSALSDFIVLLQILNRRSNYPDEHLEYVGEYRLYGNKPSESFALLTSNDRQTIHSILEDDENEGLDKFFLSEDVLDSIGDSTLSQFKIKRRKLIAAESKVFLEQLGVKIKPLEINNDVSSLETVISEFEDLNYEEKREFCSILSERGNLSSVIYDLKHLNNNLFSISYSSFQQPCVFTEESAKKCLKLIEDRYCNGEDAELYYSWMISMNGNE